MIDGRGRRARGAAASGWPRFVARRAIRLTFTLLVSSFAIFGSLYLQGDPLAALSGGKTLPPAEVTALRAEYHLNDPFLERYARWLDRTLLRGDLGTSITFHQKVSSLIGARAGITFELVGYAALLIILVGVATGVLAGLRPGLLDASILVGTAVSAAVPSFVAAIALLSVFSVSLRWFPSFGSGNGLIDGLWHLTLPACALAISTVAIVVRVARAAVRAELSNEHVQTAVSRGIPYAPRIRRHVLRNAAIPVATIVGITVASLLALSAIVEPAFGINGLGAALVEAASTNDFPVVQGIALVLVTTFVLVNAVVDLLYTWLDPRVTIGQRAA